MSLALLDGLGVTSLLLLQVAARHERVPMHLALRPPLDQDPEEGIRALVERGLCEVGEVPGLLTLSPMGYAVRDAVLGRWPALHRELRERLLVHLQVSCSLDDGPVLAALEAVDRARFVPEPATPLADLDAPAPIGVDEQTTSAPHALVAILRAVDPCPGERVLVCGAKGGVLMALAAHMVGPEGQVVGLDDHEAVVARVRASLAAHPELAGRAEVHHQADVTLGRADDAPFDVAVLNGSVPKIPWPILERLHPERGRMLLFLQVPGEEVQACHVLHRSGEVEQDEALSRYTFTPIHGRYGWDRLDEVKARLGGT